MITAEKQSREEIIQQVIKQLDKKFPTEQLQLISCFIEQYYATVSLDELQEQSITDLYGSALSFWLLAYQRKSGEVKIRVYNPQYEQHGWQSNHTIVDVNYDDMPFLVDSLRIEINRQGYNVHSLIHFGGFLVNRDNNQINKIIGRKQALNGDSNAEAIIHIEIDKQTDAVALQTLESRLNTIIADVTITVQDWQLMRNKVEEILAEYSSSSIPIPKEELAETENFLRWIKDDHFTFLGCRDYRLIQHEGQPALELVSGSGLGVLRNERYSKKLRLLAELPPEVRELVLSNQSIVTLAKTNTLATVHRRTYTDYIGVKRYSASGDLIGETRIVGLYTTTAYQSSPKDIPILRLKVDKILNRSKLPPKGHAGKDLVNILELLPRDDLFQANTDQLFELAMGILEIQERPLIRLFVRNDIYRRFISCLVYVPREKFNSELRQAMQAILEKAFSAIEISFNTRFSESILASIHFLIRIDPHQKLDYNVKEIEAKLIEVSRTWKDELKDSLIEFNGEEQGTILFQKYGDSFPAGYREDFHPRNAVHDIDHMQKLSPSNTLEMSFYRPIDEADDILRFKLFHFEQTIPLSDVVPMLENMGLRIIGERPYEIYLSDDNAFWINDFTMTYSDSGTLDIDKVKDIFQEAFAKIWYGIAENDGFNRLVLKAQLNWREVSVLRTYAKYLRQTGFMFSQNYIEDTLAQYPKVAQNLTTLFELSFNPDHPANVAEKILTIEAEIQHEIEKVVSLDEDRILRRYLDVVHGTLRTNFYQRDENNELKSYISIKLNPHGIPDIPKPVPAFEIFVYSPRFEGVHLRSSKVARGGIRWSDRREDFRTEILGLMKAQVVKNSVIVPSGAKGGFVPKALPSDGSREEIMAEVIECYKTFMRGMLDLTDNLVQGQIISPANTVSYDDADPYLVVAADKGTASFSDIANGIAKEYNFWLGDAFASGGSAGYDHKKMGITARGAWESVKRHFRELGIDIQTTDFTVIGIGDMSGDVFGNGMLRSKNIKLIGAFDHRNIFIDPNPDPATSFNERERLFNLPRSSWEDYNPTLLSPGGGVYKRSSKSIQLSPEAKECFGLTVDQIEPNELIKVLLKAQVDLLWNGGIGTYIKASTENNIDIGDRTNDFVRVNGNQLRCRVIGEGGNLGFSQLGRIEYSLNGGLCNTDFIDNSAGVDCSDHEVNIKILLNQIMTNGDMTEKQRNELLSKMTDDVADLVLKNNYQQALAISLALVHAKTHAELYRRYLNEQERLGLIDRDLEFLPSDKALAERKLQGQYLTRAELAVLLSYSKINIKRAILESDLPEDPHLSKIIDTEFPITLCQQFPSQVRNHSLKREIIATQLSNSLVNQMGAVFVYRMIDETGASIAEIIRAYFAVYDIFRIGELQSLITTLDYQILAGTQIEMLLHIKRLVRRATRWILRNRRTQLDINENINYFGDGANKLAELIPSLMVGVTREYMQQLTTQFTQAGLPSATAARVAGSRAMYTALNIVDIATQYKFDLINTAKVFFAVGSRLDLAWFRDQLNSTSLEDYWDSIARASLRDDLDIQQRQLTISILQMHADIVDIDQHLETWISKYKPLLERWEFILSNLRTATNLSFIMFYVAVRELGDLTSIILQQTAPQIKTS